VKASTLSAARRANTLWFFMTISLKWFANRWLDTLCTSNQSEGKQVGCYLD
jgi:hypothetical protein